MSGQQTTLTSLDRQKHHRTRRLTLLLESGHNLDVREVLQFVLQVDGVVLHLRRAQVTVHGRLRAEGGDLEAAAFK